MKGGGFLHLSGYLLQAWGTIKEEAFSHMHTHCTTTFLGGDSTQSKTSLEHFKGFGYEASYGSRWLLRYGKSKLYRVLR